MRYEKKTITIKLFLENGGARLKKTVINSTEICLETKPLSQLNRKRNIIPGRPALVELNV